VVQLGRVSVVQLGCGLTLRDITICPVRSITLGPIGVCGKATAGPSGLVKSPYTQKDCCFYYADCMYSPPQYYYLWYYFCKRPFNYVGFTELAGFNRSLSPFILSDQTGRCLVLPTTDAEFQGENFDVEIWALGRDKNPDIKYKVPSLSASLFGFYLYKELRILPNTELFIKGYCKMAIQDADTNPQLCIGHGDNPGSNYWKNKFIISSVTKKNLMDRFIYRSILSLILFLIGIAAVHFCS
jgi:hypothetical protein